MNSMHACSDSWLASIISTASSFFPRLWISMCLIISLFGSSSLFIRNSPGNLPNAILVDIAFGKFPGEFLMKSELDPNREIIRHMLIHKRGKKEEAVEIIEASQESLQACIEFINKKKGFSSQTTRAATFAGPVQDMIISPGAPALARHLWLS